MWRLEPSCQLFGWKWCGGSWTQHLPTPTPSLSQLNERIWLFSSKRAMHKQPRMLNWVDQLSWLEGLIPHTLRDMLTEACSRVCMGSTDCAQGLGVLDVKSLTEQYRPTHSLCVLISSFFVLDGTTHLTRQNLYCDSVLESSLNSFYTYSMRYQPTRKLKLYNAAHHRSFS